MKHGPICLASLVEDSAADRACAVDGGPRVVLAELLDQAREVCPLSDLQHLRTNSFTIAVARMNGSSKQGIGLFGVRSLSVDNGNRALSRKEN
jgi:hypothetical protein